MMARLSTQTNETLQRQVQLYQEEISEQKDNIKVNYFTVYQHTLNIAIVIS